MPDGVEDARARSDGAGRQTRPAVGRVIRVRHPAGMGQLDHDSAAAIVHGVGHAAPAGHMGVGVDAGRGHIALTVFRRLGALGYDQAQARTLAVVFGGQRARRPVRFGPIAGHGRHDEPVGQTVRSKLHLVEEAVHARDLLAGGVSRFKIDGGHDATPGFRAMCLYSMKSSMARDH